MTLNPNVWLNDEIINAYISLIDKQKSEELIIFNTYFYELLNQNNPIKINRILKKKIKSGVPKYVIIPVNFVNYHWSLIFLNLSKKIIYLVDSIYP